MFIGLFVAAALLGVFALAVRFAGTDRILNFVAYDRVADRAALHAWVGHRLLVLAAVAALLGVLAFRMPSLALLFVVGFIVATLVAVAWMVTGSGRFQSRSAD
jgi:hypothetical protein